MEYFLALMLGLAFYHMYAAMDIITKNQKEMCDTLIRIEKVLKESEKPTTTKKKKTNEEKTVGPDSTVVK